MAVLLQQAGYEVTVITAMPNYPTGRIFKAYRGKLWHREIIDGIVVIRLWLMPSNARNVWMRGLSALTYLWSVFFLSGPQLVFGKPDLVIITSPPLFSAWLSAFLARCGGKRVLVNISDLWPLTAMEMGALKLGFTFRLLQRMERSLYKMAAAFTGQSEAILEHIHASVKKQKPAQLYRNLQSGKPVSIGSSGNCLDILYAGNLGHAQGMLALCEAIHFEALGARLSIYGDGGERALIASFLAAHPDRGIFLHSTIPQKELDERLSDFDIMLVPLKTPIHGAVPSKLFLAIAAGMPVLFIAGGEGAQIVAKYRLGWVREPGDYAGLKQAIKEAAQMPTEAIRTMTAQIQEVQRTVFSKEMQDQQFCQFIEQLLRNRQA